MIGSKPFTIGSIANVHRLVKTSKRIYIKKMVFYLLKYLC